MPFTIPQRPGEIPAHVGPMLLGSSVATLLELPYNTLDDPVSARWVPVHTYRERADGTKEPFWNGLVQRAYRLEVSGGWSYLERFIAAAITEAAMSGSPLYVAPYSTAEGEPYPAAFLCNLVGEVQDEEEMVTRTRPVHLDFESAHVFTTGNVPTRDAVGGGYTLLNARTAERDGHYEMEPYGNGTIEERPYPVAIIDPATGQLVEGTRYYAELGNEQVAAARIRDYGDGTATIITALPEAQ